MSNLRFSPSRLMRRLMDNFSNSIVSFLRLFRMTNQQSPTRVGYTKVTNDQSSNSQSCQDYLDHVAISEPQIASSVQHTQIIDSIKAKFIHRTSDYSGDGIDGASHIHKTKTDEDVVVNECKITDQVKQLLDNNGWHHYYHPPKPQDNPNIHHLTLGMRNDGLEWGCLIRIQEDTQFVAMYGILPEHIPESHRASAILMMTQVNYDLMIGNVEMDLTDGEIRYKVSQDMERVGVSDATVMPLFQSVIAMTHVVYRLVQDLLEEVDPAQDLDELLTQLQQQEDSRRFFLLSEMMQ